MACSLPLRFWLAQVVIISLGAITDILTPITPVWIWPVTALVALAALVTAAIVDPNQKVRLWFTKTSSTSSPSKTGDVQTKVTTNPSKTGDVQTKVTTNKIYTIRTVGEILESVEKLTNLEIANVSKPHLGKWLRVDNVIREITEVQ